MKPLFHIKSSVRKFGGIPEDYERIHNWFDSTKAFIPDQRHRLILHNAWGIFLCEQVFGISITNADGKDVPVRSIAEQHVLEDLGHIPTFEDCFRDLPNYDWVGGKVKALNIKIVPSDD